MSEQNKQPEPSIKHTINKTPMVSLAELNFYKDKFEAEREKVRNLEAQNKIMRDALAVVFNSEDGDIDYIKFKINSILKEIEVT